MWPFDTEAGLHLLPTPCHPAARRQAYRTLRALLGYDPSTVPMGEPGYGAGSGAPDLMFGFLKHLWATQSRHDALLRCWFFLVLLV